MKVTKVGMALMRPGDQSSLALDVKHFISPSEEVIEEEEKVTFEQLLSIATNPRGG